MPPALIVPKAAFPPGIPFTLQVTVLSVALLTMALNVCVSPNRTLAVDGATVTVILGGGCGLPGPTTPQPRNDATRNNAGHQRNAIRAGWQRPRSFVLLSIAA